MVSESAVEAEGGAEDAALPLGPAMVGEGDRLGLSESPPVAVGAPPLGDAPPGPSMTFTPSRFHWKATGPSKSYPDAQTAASVTVDLSPPVR